MPGTPFPRDNRCVLIMSAWVNESCRFHLINTSPFLAIHIRHAGPGAVYTARGSRGTLGAGKRGRGCEHGAVSGEPGLGGAQGGSPWELSREIPLHAPFLQGPLRGRKGHPDMLPFLLQLRLTPSKGHWEGTSPGGLRPTRGGIPGHHAQVQVPKPRRLAPRGGDPGRV